MKILLLHKHYTRDVHTVTQNTEKLSIKMKIKVTVEPNARRQRQWVTRSGKSVVQWYASYIVSITSVSETIRKPLLVKAQTALRKQKNGEKRFSIWRMEFLHSAMWHVHDIDFARWQPCNVAIGSGITTVNSPSGIRRRRYRPNLQRARTRSSGMTFIEFARWQHTAMWQVALGWHAIEFAQTSAILEFYFWFRFQPYHHSAIVILH